jgi:hypothetical protein
MAVSVLLGYDAWDVALRHVPSVTSQKDGWLGAVSAGSHMMQQMDDFSK